VTVLLRSAAPPAPFPEAGCPDCGAALVRIAWRDPITGIEYAAQVRHLGACAVYRARAYDRSEPIAHLLRIGGATPETRTAEEATSAVADPKEGPSGTAVDECTPDRVTGSTAAAGLEARATA
jgi:hypothetical protein